MSKLLHFTALLSLAGALALIGATTNAAAANSYSIQISRASFTPSTRYLAPGDTVTWYNADTVSHRIVSGFGFNSRRTLSWQQGPNRRPDPGPQR